MKRKLHSWYSWLRVRLLIIAVLGVLCGVLWVLMRIGIVNVPYIGHKMSSDWEVVQCDVGQGSALLVRSGDDVVLIDVGPEHGGVDRCLREARVHTIDLLVLSHFDADHVRGLDSVLEQAHVHRVWVSENPYPSYNSEWVQHRLFAYGITSTAVRSGANYNGWLEVLAPGDPMLAEDYANADSLVVRASTAHHSVLALGDVPAEVQDSLTSRGLQADIVIVAHHGARSQSESLARELKPQVALISVGVNGYGHPTATAQQIWRAPVQATTLQCGWVEIEESAVHTQRRCELETASVG